ncbi:MAG: transglutaminase domain-containing protein, partial [Nocardioides sp.]
ASDTRARIRTGWLPGRQTWTDLGFLVALCTAALVGLATTFTGSAFLVVGLVGLLLGLTITHVTGVLRWPGVAAVVIGLAAFVLLGGPLCLRSEGIGAFLPGPSTVSGLGEQVVFGWKDLLTTLPPVDGDGPLLVLPWALGLGAGLLGGLTARLRSGPMLLRAALPLLAPALLLTAVILVGVRRPQSLWIQGVVFTVLAIGWLALRAQRDGAPVHGGTGRARRLVLGGALVVGAGLLALPVATWGSGSDAERVVLRTYVAPPFDIGQYPSPLASFRRYVEMPEPDAVNLYDETLLSVEGAPEGSRLRIATLDHYDGTVWGAANDTLPGTSTDSFQRVSSTIDNPVEGEAVEVSVTVADGYSAVWLPTVGALQSMEFDRGEAEAKAESFRYNLATSTAVVPAGVGPGDTYHFTAVVPDGEVSADDAPSGLVTDAAFAAGFLDTQAVQWSEGTTDPMARVFAVADYLRTEGKYSDGVLEAEKIYHPGHHLRRLSEEFVNAPIIVGNDEQYAATMALLANRIGVPARVVLGAVVPADGLIEGQDVQAWVELQVADGSWRTLPTETFMDTDRPAEQPPVSEEEQSGTVVPPPAPIPPPSTLAEQNDTELDARKLEREDEKAKKQLSGWIRVVLLYVGGPLLLSLLAIAAILGAKMLRRRHRRRSDRMSARIVGGWNELVDHARDLGRSVPVGAGWTRREQSSLVATSRAPALAREADSHVFGPSGPGADDAAAYWSSVDLERRVMSSAANRWTRLRA